MHPHLRRATLALGLLFAASSCNRAQGGAPVSSSSDPLTQPHVEPRQGGSPSRAPSVTSGPVTLRGLARDAKGGAVLVREGHEPVYLEGLEAWPAGLHGRQVRVTGRLLRKKLIPDPHAPGEPIRQGAEGDQLVIERASWQLAE